MDLWFDASTLDGAEGSAVDPWLDQSGNGRNITAPSGVASRRPTLRRGVLNGRPVVRLDGNDCLSVAFATLPHARTWFWVASLTGNAGATSLLFDAWVNGVATPAGRQSLLVNTGVNGAVQMYAGTQQNVGALTAPQATAIWSLVYNGASSAIYRNGTAHSLAGNVGNSGLTGFILGARFSNTANQAADVAEIVAYSSVLSTADRRRVESYLSTKYAIGVA